MLDVKAKRFTSASSAVMYFLVLIATGCASSRVAVRPTVAAATSATIQAIVREALALDATQDRGADSLYAGDATIVANSRIRLGPPRFAGVAYGGRVTVASATAVTLQGRFAWAIVDYRWVNAEQRLAEAGRATFILEERPGGWKIVHAHSSHLLPWDR